MVDRHEQLRAGGIGHCHRLLRRAVIADPRVVGANRHHRRFERTVAPMIREERRGRGVAADQQPAAFTLDDVAVVAAVGVALQPVRPNV